jgi:hypothetical protein
MAQDDLKMDAGWLKIVKYGPNMAPRWLKMAPRCAPKDPMTVPIFELASP